MDTSAIREAAGLTAEQLPDDATPEQIAAALREAPAPEPTPPAPAAAADPTSEPTPPQEPAPAEAPEQIAAQAGTVHVSAEVWNETTSRLERLEAGDNARREAEQKARRDRTVQDAVRATRIAPSERDHYRAMLDVDEEKTTQLLAGLAPGRVPTSQIAAEEAADQQGASQGTGLFTHLEPQE